MPSPHTRIGLVVDEDVSAALSVMREQAGDDVPQAGLARRAVFDGAALAAVIREARGASARRDAAQRLLQDLRALLEGVPLPDAVLANVLEEIDRAGTDEERQERRRRQRTLLRSSDPHGLTALRISDAIDDLDADPV
ncbi:MAG TPA: hypothetical protein VN238_04810 [Solirubrobacteraceae bacterium]|nr:hypothetical protein [Solirubrobacteraceae bacterium]